MSSESTTPKRSLRGSIGSLFDKGFHISAHPQSKHSLQDPNPNIDGSTAPSASRNPSELPYAGELSPHSPQGPGPAENRQTSASSALQGTLRALHQSAEVFPPLQAAIGSLVTALDAVPMAREHRRSYDNLLTELQALHAGIDKYRDAIRLTGMSDGTANIILSIEAEAKFLKSKREKGHTTRILNADKDEEDLIQCYRRVETLSRQLQSNIGLGTWDIAFEQLMVPVYSVSL
ncbi:unnamed protein product [Rhizoctonia solani]|uniref:Uncharacterized protein n=1 Tax=Rhizoctonia solani TaxID=456999 RepID=A0A8H2XZU7_9AGAM|nr:unnamed protein product [Rhizoctonia solani]